jgi:hypothetical protein
MVIFHQQNSATNAKKHAVQPCCHNMVSTDGRNEQVAHGAHVCRHGLSFVKGSKKDLGLIRVACCMAVATDVTPNPPWCRFIILALFPTRLAAAP